MTMQLVLHAWAARYIDIGLTKLILFTEIHAKMCQLHDTIRKFSSVYFLMEILGAVEYL